VLNVVIAKDETSLKQHGGGVVYVSYVSWINSAKRMSENLDRYTYRGYLLVLVGYGFLVHEWLQKIIFSRATYA